MEKLIVIDVPWWKPGGLVKLDWPDEEVEFPKFGGIPSQEERLRRWEDSWGSKSIDPVK